MGRSKASSRVRSLTPRTVSVRPSSHDHADHVKSLVDFLASFPDAVPRSSSPAGEPGQEPPPAKRAKLIDGHGAIPIVRHNISSVARSKVSAPAPIHICRRDAGRFLKMELRMTGQSVCGEAHYELHITPRARSRTSPSPSAFWLSQPLDLAELSDTLATAFHVAQVQWSDPGAGGCLWASVDIDVRQDGTEVDLGLMIEVFWNEGQSPSSESRTRRQQALRHEVLNTCFPALNYVRKQAAERWSPQDFYGASYVPEKDKFDPSLLDAEIPGLAARLFPFQRRCIWWLLGREHASWTKAAGGEESVMLPLDTAPSSGRPLSFVTAKDAFGRPFSISPLLGLVVRESPRRTPAETLKGGVLAEEMGLGKTLEIIGLILLHRRPREPSLVHDPFLGRQLIPTGATLIIAPSPLLGQWRSELSRHAPQLKVKPYAGLRNSVRGDWSEADVVGELAGQDVVLTTYEVLRSELHMAMDPPDRSMRRERKYERPRSPLIQLSWWRVCIDEAQMVENWTSNSATLARLIPRVNAWAVTGTPVKDDVKRDLRGLLNFLRVEPYASDSRVWDALFMSDKVIFRALFNSISLRHSKSLVRDELALPAQKRYVITMPFSAIEEQHYLSLFKDLAQACGLDTHGNPTAEDWDPESPAVQQAMRVALDRLRQTALHPEVGVHNRRALGRRTGPLRTVSEVLDAMLDQSESAIRTDQRALLNLDLTRGQILAGLDRARDALAVWEDVLKRSIELVSDCRSQLKKEVEKARGEDGAAHPEADAAEESEDKEDSIQVRVSESRRRLRYALEVQHKAVFFCANAYYTIKSDKDTTQPDGEEYKQLEQKEVGSYDSAKSIREEILSETLGKAKRLMAKMAVAAAGQEFTVIPEVGGVDLHGIESLRILEAFDELAMLLNNQANQVDEWREHVIQLLLQPLLDEDSDDVTGEEYEQSTKLQDEILVYVHVLRSAVADRQDALSGQRNFLAEYEYKSAVRQAEEGEGPFPEKLLGLFRIRDALKPQVVPGDELGSVRGIIAALRALSVKLRNDAASGSHRAETELTIVTSQLTFIQSQATQQMKAATLIEQEVEEFVNTMNARLDFYRQLQAVSDMVADYEGPKTLESLAFHSRQEDSARRALETAESKHRYLLHLKEADSAADEQRLCIICQSTFSIGVLTVCGHQFCKECITLWYRAHRNCPVCKRRLDRTNLHDISLKPQELRVHSETPAGNRATATSSPSKKTSIYAEFSREKLEEIKNIDLAGPSFTTKVDTLVRHLLWLRSSDPGAKSIVFSQYKDFLDVLALAFKRHRIGWAAFDKADGISSFREDPGTEVFLLHARAHSSGLNLVNASHVFLCEPLLNTALELQAIARVDRIGQVHETTVWLYIADGTVEESIYNLSVQRRMEHVDQNPTPRAEEPTGELSDDKLQAANSLELEQAQLSRLMGKDGISGEAVDKKDLWTCLFGHIKSEKPPGDEEIRSNPAIRGFLAAEAAEERLRARGVEDAT